MKYPNLATIIILIMIVSVSWNGVFAQTVQHYFEIWPKDRYTPVGSLVTIQGNICPAPVPDAGTSSSIKTYGLKQLFGITTNFQNKQIVKNTITYFLGENNTLPSCSVPSSITTFKMNYTLPYDAYEPSTWYTVNAIAQWTEKGKTITVQSGSTPVRTSGSCIASSNLSSNSQLHPGGMASFKFHVYSFNCRDSSTGVTFTAYNYTGNVKGNILYQESKPVTDDDTLFNFTVPQWTGNNGQFHFVVEVNGTTGGFTYSYPVTSSSINNNLESSTLVENKTDNQSDLQKQLDQARIQIEKQQDEETETTLHLAEVGIPIAVGISIGVFLFTRKRK